MNLSPSHLPHFLVPLLLAFFLPTPTLSRLIHDPSHPEGQTQRPTGLHHILYPPLKHYLPPSTPSTLHPFHTLHDFPCQHITRKNLTLPDNTSVHTRLASNSQVSTMLHAASNPPFSAPPTPIIILFHGGPSCEWSRQILPIWAQVEQRMMPVCMVAVDGRRYSLVNYNLIVLGFPTILRVQSDRKAEVYRGPRKVDRLTEWVVDAMGVPPDQWQQSEHASPPPVKWSDATEEWDWVLVGANFVCALNLISALLRLLRWMRARWRKEG
eukprot:GFKZ01006956.1.p1 GENE.GFKZ01006956.1~~GFKZ01006956.1.p1  ORF type:complete len:276 (+),score=21.37 GFKZ01006956.1:27-830(+)